MYSIMRCRHGVITKFKKFWNAINEWQVQIEKKGENKSREDIFYQMIFFYLHQL